MKSFLAVRFVICVVLICVFCLAGSRKTLEQALANTTTAGVRAVAFELTLPGGKSSRLVSIEGQMAKVGNRTEKWEFGLIPLVKNMEKGIVQFEIFAIATPTLGNETFHFVRSVNADMSSAAPSGLEHNFLVRVLQVTQASDDEQNSESAERTLDILTGSFGVPMSGRIIYLNITLPDGRLARVGLGEGQIGRIGKRGVWEFGLVPFIEDESRKMVHLDIFRITGDQAAKEPPRFIQNIEATSASFVSTTTQPELHVQVRGFEDIH